MKPTVTMQDVADAARVSLMTVSYALRGDPCISPETTQRVLEKAQTLGYRKNALVAALMTQIRGKRTKSYHPTIAFLSTYSSRASMLENPFRRAFFDGAASYAEECGFNLELELLPNEESRTLKRAVDVLLYKNVQGIVCGTSQFNSAARAFDWTQFASCAIGFNHAYSTLDCVDSNYRQGVVLCLSKLEELGYQKVGFLCSVFEDDRVYGSILGTIAGLNLRRPASTKICFVRLTPKQWNPKFMKNWVLQHKLDALVVQSHRPFDFLSEAGMKVPDQLAIITFDVIGDTPLGGLQRYPKKIGAAAVSMVVEKINRNEHGVSPLRKSILFDCDWVDSITAPRRK